MSPHPAFFWTPLQEKAFSELLSLRAASDIKRNTTSNLSAAEYYDLVTFASGVV
ncbi:MAG: hypothetical protein KatS3mg101_0460 [Patescibacteria group bacterium]|nr:MAG: hypothetical protein KatS3mg101_0460 [Patescibacteria group bacterium]